MNFHPFLYKNSLLCWRPLSLLLGICLGFCACTKSSNYREVPVPMVHLTVQPYGMDNTLGPVGNYKVFPNYGYAGIIVYHLSQSDFLAYDLACPNDYEQGGTVVYNPQNLTLTDSKCKSVFSILNGFPVEGNPYPSPLHMYNTLWDPRSQILLIYN